MFLDYISTEPIPESVAETVTHEARMPFMEHERYWAPIDLVRNATSGKLYGRVALAGPHVFAEEHREAFRGMPEAEERFYGCVGTRARLALLEHWAARYSISWSVAGERGVHGTVSSGYVSPELRRFVGARCGFATILPTDAHPTRSSVSPAGRVAP